MKEMSIQQIHAYEFDQRISWLKRWWSEWMIHWKWEIILWITWWISHIRLCCMHMHTDLFFKITDCSEIIASELLVTIIQVIWIFNFRWINQTNNNKKYKPDIQVFLDKKCGENAFKPNFIFKPMWKIKQHHNNVYNKDSIYLKMWQKLRRPSHV